MSICRLWSLQSANDRWVDGCGACLMMKNIGKPCAGKPHARFDEGGRFVPPAYSTQFLANRAHGILHWHYVRSQEEG